MFAIVRQFFSSRNERTPYLLTCGTAEACKSIKFCPLECSTRARPPFSKSKGNKTEREKVRGRESEGSKTNSV